MKRILVFVVVLMLASSSWVMAKLPLRVREVTLSGSVIVLDDDTTWKVGSMSQLKSSLWMSFDQVKIFKTNTQGVYQMFNVRNDDMIIVTYLGSE